jgi:hypothetical protein
MFCSVVAGKKLYVFFSAKKAVDVRWEVVAPSLSLCYPPPACFGSCSPAICLPYFLIVMYWLMSLPSLEIDTTSDKFLFLAPVFSILSQRHFLGTI